MPNSVPDVNSLKAQHSQLSQTFQTKTVEVNGLMGAWAGKELEMPKDVSDKIDSLLGETDIIKVNMGRLNAAIKGNSFLGEPQSTPVSWRNSGPNEGDMAIDVKGWRNMEVDTMFGKKEVRWFVPLAIEKKGKDYVNAFEAYMQSRTGVSGIGPNDFKTLTEGTDSAGGFVVPPDFQAQIIKKQMTLTQIRANAFISTTSRDAQQWPKINYTTDDNFTSGVRLTWTGEAPATSTAHRVTDPVTGMYTVPVHTAMASIPLSNDLLEDQAVDMSGVASDLFAEAFALGEENVFLNGTGAGQPTGILAEANTNGPAWVVSSTNDAIVGDDIISLFYAVPVQYRTMGKWLMNSATMAILEKLKDSQNRYLVSSLLQASLATPQMDTLKGKPILIDEFAPSVADATLPIIFGNWQGYMVLDRVGLSIQKLTEVYAELNVTVLLGRKRVGGYCIRPWQFRILKIQ